MGTFQAVADSNSTIGYARYGSSSWSKGSTSGACQGAYENTSSSGSRVGVMAFSGAGAALSGKIITQISLTIVCPSAGSGSSSKVLTFHKANYQYLETGVNGSAQVGVTLGTLTGKFYNNTTTHVLSQTSNAAFFSALAEYLMAGNSAVVIYNGEVSSSEAGAYSNNYARINSCTLVVQYEDATVWYCDNGTWRQCAAWYHNGNGWQRCAPYYNNNGVWVRV